MIRHLHIVLVIVGVVVLSGSLIAAIVVGPACPRGWHDQPEGGCVTDATHIAPSSGVRLPVAVMMERPSRTRERIGILIVGALSAGILLWFGLSDGLRRAGLHEVAPTGSSRYR
jgi:hypothetical protein